MWNAESMKWIFITLLPSIYSNEYEEDFRADFIFGRDNSMACRFVAF